LLQLKPSPIPVPDVAVSKVGFVNFNENEETTCMQSISYLHFSCFKSYIVVPLLSILSVFYLPIHIYWSVSAEASWLYSEVDRIERASHVLIHGRDGNIEICKLQNLT
jgi:hypothetical protein